MTILITGASSGIGYATALALAAQKHYVIAIARNQKKLDSLKAQNPKYIQSVTVDINENNYGLVLRARLMEKGLDIVINNAGLLIKKPFMKLTREDFFDVYNTNVFSMAALIQVSVPYLQKSKHAHIVNITSMGGVQGSSKFAGLSAYSSSKGAVSILTECLAEELKEKNISVNALAMGAVETPMLNKAFPGYKAPVTSETTAAFIAWFAVNGRQHFNGKTLPVSMSTP